MPYPHRSVDNIRALTARMLVMLQEERDREFDAISDGLLEYIFTEIKERKDKYGTPKSSDESGGQVRTPSSTGGTGAKDAERAHAEDVPPQV